MTRRRLSLLSAIGGVALLGAGALVVASIRSFPERLRCVDPVPETVRGKPTGYARCANGSKSRPTQLTCPSFLPRGEELVRRDERHMTAEMRQLSREQRRRLGSQEDCRFDHECTQKPHGHCFEARPSGRPGCAYGCVSDSECSGGICVCGDPVGYCMPASCTTNRDCEAPAVCSEYAPSPGCANDNGFACQQPADECASDGDCSPNHCGWNASQQRRVCVVDYCMN